MKMTLKINLDAILDRIYAESAWRAAHRNDIYTLTPDNERMLSLKVGQGLNELLAHMAGYVTDWNYNPNIEPEEEYRHRLSEQERLLSLLPGDVKLLPCEYDHGAFAAFAEGMADCPEGGDRCLACFALRLNETARQAKAHGFEYFTTTLSVSPHKNADNVNRIGEAAGREAGVKYLMADFKKKNGYLRSLQLSKEFDLYRQDYCGCLYSKAPRGDAGAGE